MVYYPLPEFAEGVGVPDAMRYVVRAPNAAALAGAARETVRGLDPTLPITDVETLETLVARARGERAFVMVLLVIAAGLALLLGSIGLYGVVSYLVAQRRREIAIRMAVGAQVTDVRRLVLVDAGWMALLGVVLGAGAAAALTRRLQAVLFETAPPRPRRLRHRLGAAGRDLPARELAPRPPRRGHRPDDDPARRVDFGRVRRAGRRRGAPGPPAARRWTRLGHPPIGAGRPGPGWLFLGYVPLRTPESAREAGSWNDTDCARSGRSGGAAVRSDGSRLVRVGADGGGEPAAGGAASRVTVPTAKARVPGRCVSCVPPPVPEQVGAGRRHLVPGRCVPRPGAAGIA